MGTTYLHYGPVRLKTMKTPGTTTMSPGNEEQLRRILASGSVVNVTLRHLNGPTTTAAERLGIDLDDMPVEPSNEMPRLWPGDQLWEVKDQGGSLSIIKYSVTPAD